MHTGRTTFNTVIRTMFVRPPLESRYYQCHYLIIILITAEAIICVFASSSSHEKTGVAKRKLNQELSRTMKRIFCSIAVLCMKKSLVKWCVASVQFYRREESHRHQRWYRQYCCFYFVRNRIYVNPLLKYIIWEIAHL